MIVNSENNFKKSNKAVIVAAFLLVLAVLYLLSGIFLGFYIPCPFRAVTGFKCPGCGMSHAATHLAMAAAALFRGDTQGAYMLLKSAFYYSALFPVIFAYIIIAAAGAFHREISNDQKPSGEIDIRIEIINVAFLIVILAWWVLRNVIGR